MAGDRWLDNGVSFLLSPVMVVTLKNSARMQEAKPEMEQLSRELRMAPTGQVSRQEYYRKLAVLQKKYDFSMGRSFAPMMVQGPVFVWFFSSISALLAYNPESITGGALWFADLTARDPYMRLNVLTAVVMHLSFRLGAELGNVNVEQTQKTIMKAFSYVFPSCMCL